MGRGGPSERPPEIALLISLAIGVLAISTAAIFARFAMEAAGRFDGAFGASLATGRLSIAAVTLVLGGGGRRMGPPGRRALVLAIAAGGFLAIHFVCWLASLAYTSVAASTVLVTTNPIWIAIAQWVGGRRPPWPMVAGIGVATVGSVVLAAGPAAVGASGQAIAGTALLGNGLALLGAMAASGYLLCGRAAQRAGLSVGSYATVAYGSAAIVLLPLPVIVGVAPFGQPAAVYGWLAAMALLPQLVGHTAVNWTTRWLSPAFVALAILFEPVGAGVLAWLCFGEVPGGTTAAGAIAIAVGVAMAAGARSD